MLHTNNDSRNCSYSTAPEILKYFKNVATKHELYRFIKLRQKVVSAKWNESNSQWDLEIEDLETGTIYDDWCDFLINGSGILKYAIHFFPILVLHDLVLTKYA